jgi:hypothetical protein
MSRHWKPDVEIARARGQRRRTPWPEGATVGLLVVAAACLGIAAVLYQVAGPRDVIEDDSGVDWNAWQ